MSRNHGLSKKLRLWRVPIICRPFPREKPLAVVINGPSACTQMCPHWMKKLKEKGLMFEGEQCSFVTANIMNEKGFYYSSIPVRFLDNGASKDAPHHLV